MTEKRKEEIEHYISDWYWNKKSQKFAFELASYLFDFMDYIEEESGLGENTLRKHYSNCSIIGLLTCQYGFFKSFSPDVFKYPPYHDIEFSMKISHSKYQIQYYNATCNKLEKYALQKGDIAYDDE